MINCNWPGAKWRPETGIARAAYRIGSPNAELRSAPAGAGTAVEDMLFYPWGDVWQSQGSGGYNFAELPYYDGNTNTSPTMYRFYSMGLGRWHSPDPAGGDISNPQSLNRYSYVANNPTSVVDPLGLQGGCPPGSEQHGICRGGVFYPPGGPVYPFNPFTNPGWNWDIFDLAQ